jgi:hypothetical protein
MDLMPVAAVMSPLTYGAQPRRFALGSDRLAEVHRIGVLLLVRPRWRNNRNKGQGGVPIDPKLVSGYYSTNIKQITAVTSSRKSDSHQQEELLFSVFCF